MGEVFAGRYELVDPIGRGGVGAVWRAWDQRRRRYVAAKVLQQSDAHTLLRFVREQALRIDHPHVLAPASWAADDDKVLFTMDLVGGGSLAHLIGDYGPLPPAFVCTLLDQLLAGLAAVHAEGVVHRDIKPANVLLEATGTRRPHLRLSDFGISMRKGEPRLTETNYVVGTPGYFAPEQIAGSEPDFPADLFAVGLVALYLLEGAKPDAKALVERFTTYGTPSAPKDIPEPLWQVIAGLLQPDPQARFRTATGARKALAGAAEMLPEPGPDDELVEVFDQIGPLPAGFGPQGPLPAAPRQMPGPVPQPPGTVSAPAQPPTPPPAVPESGSFLPPPPAYGPPVPDAASFTGHQAHQGQESLFEQRGQQGQQSGAQESGAQPSAQHGVPLPGPSAPVTPPPPVPSAAPSLPTAPPAAPPSEPGQGQPAAGPPSPPQHPPSAHTAPPQPSHQTPHPASPHQLSSPQQPAPLTGPPAGPSPGIAPGPDSSQVPTAPAQRETAPTRPYTGRHPQVPSAPHPMAPQDFSLPTGAAGAGAPQGGSPFPDAPLAGASAPAAGTRASAAAAVTERRPSRRKARPKRPGPPLKVAIPMLVVALACIAFGVWMLTQA